MIKYISLFSGIGAFEKALDNLKIPYDLINFCEFDKYATKSYCAIHGMDAVKNLGDITKINENELPTDIDLITYGFPCQDISIAGNQNGLFNVDGTITRSGLFFDALRIINHCKPKVAIAENVKNLVSKKFNEQFKLVLESLKQAGYNNYWKVLNAKDYGIPQNRERVFIVSIRKDIDNGVFSFPDPQQLKLKLKDMLEETVNEKYYIKNKILTEKEMQLMDEMQMIAYCLDASYYKGTNVKQYLQKKKRQLILETKIQNTGNPLRKLTPKECFRLMGFSDDDFAKAAEVNSNTQLYKQAGNSIVVDVLEELFCMLFDTNNNFYI